MKFLNFKLLFIFILFFKSLDLQAVTLNLGSEKDIDLAYFVSTFEDSNSVLTFKDIYTNQNTFFAKTIYPTLLDFGFTESTVWVKLEYKNAHSQHTLRIENTAIYVVDYYFVNEKGILIKTGKTGIDVPRKYWEIDHHFPSIPIIASGNNTYTLYFKATSKETLALNMSLKSPKQTFDEAYYKQFLAGMYYGMILIMILYNFFIYISFKEKAYLWYILYMAATFVGQFNIEGRYLMYISPNNPPHAIFVAALCFGLILIFAKLFITSFIPKKYISNWQTLLFKVSNTMCVIAIIFAIFTKFDIAIFLLYIDTLFLFLPLMLYTIYSSYMRGFLASRFLIIGWTCVIIGAVIFSASAFGFINYSLWSVNAFLIGTVIEILFLSFALGDKINIIRQDKDDAINRTLVQLRENSQLLQALNKEQKNTLTAFIKGEERERTRLAKELHDSLGQILSVIKMHASAFVTIFQNNKVLHHYQENLLNLNSQIDEACVETRNISYNLLPLLVEEYGIYVAIEELVKKYNVANKSIVIKTLFKNTTKSLSKENELILYRVVQESISNIIKHANAKEAFLQFFEDENILFITIEDNGIGFDSNEKNFKKGMGLDNMKSRINYLKGYFFMDSQINKGTQIFIEIPIQQTI